MRPCLICQREDTTSYTIKRGNVTRQVWLCPEHSANLEALIIKATQRHKEPSKLVQLDELKPSKASEARRRRGADS